MRVEINGEVELMADLAALDERIRDFSPAFDEVAENLDAHLGRTFETEGTEIGVPWATHATETIEARKARWGYYGDRGVAGGGAGVLRWSGQFERSFRTLSRSSRELVFGTKNPGLALIHARRGRTTLDFRDEAQEDEVVVAPFRRHLEGE